MMKTRNLAARSPLLRKGGPHRRSTSAARFAGRRALASALDELAAEPRRPADPARNHGRAPPDRLEHSH